MTFSGPWPAGPIQKVVVTMLALRMEEVGLHPFHASAVRYHDKTVLFLGGESNHGKSMGQIEACKRGAKLVSTETTVIDETGTVVVGSKEPFLKKRTEGTERADKAAPERGVDKFFGAMPTWEIHTEPSNVDLVIVPAIDGNFDASSVEMIPFERQFQTFHSLQNYFLLNELLAPGLRDAGGRHRSAPRDAGRFRPAVRRAAVRLHPGGDAAGAARRSRSGALGPGDASLRVRATDHAPRCRRPARRGWPEARPLAGGTDLIIRLRDGSIQPRVVVDLEADRRAGRRDPRARDGRLTIGARTVMTDIAADARIRREFTGAGRGGGRRRVRSRSGTGRRSPATSATPRRRRTRRLPCSSTTRRWSWPVRMARGGSRSTTFFVRSGVTTLARGELVTAIELPRPASPPGAVHVRRTRRRGHDLASVTLACAVQADGTTRLAYGSLGPRPVLVTDETGVLADPACAGARQDGAPRDVVRGGQPVRPLDAGEPGVPAGDAPRPRSSGGRDRGRAARGRRRRRDDATLAIELTVNGRPRSIEVAPHHTLLEVLRDDLGLTGTKECCLVGECGACTVMVDGVSVDSCLMLAVEADGATVGTVEGMATGDRLHPLQQAFLDTGAAQCGFCIPGQLVSARGAARADAAPDPRRDRGGPGRQPLPLRRLRADHRGGPGGRGRRNPRDDERGAAGR